MSKSSTRTVIKPVLIAALVGTIGFPMGLVVGLPIACVVYRKKLASIIKK